MRGLKLRHPHAVLLETFENYFKIFYGKKIRNANKTNLFFIYTY